MMFLRGLGFSLILMFLISFSFAASFGEISDENGEEIKPYEVTSWGGSVYKVPTGQGEMNVKYTADGSEVNYNDLDGDLIFSEHGQVVEGDVEVKKAGKYAFGNLKLELKEGSKVVFKNGEISIINPNKDISRDDVDFVDSDIGWGGQNIKLSGDGVSYMGLSEVYVDSFGYYLLNPKDISFDDFVLSGDGKVYFLDNLGGMSELEIDGAYISVGALEKKFSIGSNAFGMGVSVKVNPTNKYGLLSDVTSDYIAFQSVSGGSQSYLSVSDRTASGLVPLVETVGYFAIDEDTKSFYRNGADNKVYVNSNGLSVSGISTSGGETMSPIETRMYDLGPEGSKVPLSEYGGVVLAGNDGQIAYGYDASYVPGKKYGRAGGKLGVNLNYGLSNTLVYNYHLNEEGIKRMFKINNIIDRYGFLKNPKNVRMVADVLARLPKAANWLKTLEFTGSGGGIAGMASGRKVWLYSAGQNPGVFAHELTHTYDFGTGGGFERDWAAIRGSGGVHTWSYGSWGGSYEAKATVGEYVFASDTWWSNFFKGNGGYNNAPGRSGQMAAKVAVMAKYGHIQHYDAARILSHAGYTVDSSDPVKSYNEVISKWS